MSFKNSSSTEMESMSDINVTPLVDVMLVLLVVFIITAPLFTQAIKVDLPQTVKSEIPPENHLATITIDAQGNVALNDAPQTLEMLEKLLYEIFLKDTEVVVQFQSDKNVPYGRVAEIMAILHKVGIVKLAFITKQV